jgi:DNA-binding CsgD family transcriptional regulator/PAS domain-containing protein
MDQHDAMAAGGGMSLAAFDRVQHALYGAVGRDEAWPGVVRVIAEAFDASVACWCSTDAEAPQEQSFYAAWNLPEDLRRAYQDHWVQHSPWLHAGMAQGAFVQGRVLRGTDLVPAPALRQTRFYREYMALYPVEHMLTAVVSDGSVPGLAPPMILNLFRRPGQPDFDLRDIERLHLLFPHLLRAFDLHWVTRRLQEQVGLLHRFLDALDFGVVMLDPAARVLYANHGARAMVEAPRWARWLGSLPAHVAAHDPLGRLVHACARGQGGGAVLGDGAAELLALALPIEDKREGGSGTAQPGACMLLLTRHAHAPSAVSDFVMRIFGLSPAEGRLLPPLLRGSAPTEIAAELGVKISTVRSQLSSIFAKTGATRQQDLIRLLGSVPPIQLPPP